MNLSKPLLCLIFSLSVLACGGGSGGESVDTEESIASDTTPDAFNFIDQLSVDINSLIFSNSITITGINASTSISISGGEYSVDGSQFTSETGTIKSNQSVIVRLLSSNNYSSTANATLTVGGVSDTFTVITITANDMPVANAGDDITATFGDTITLNASGSTDSDGTIISYEWEENSHILSTEAVFSKSDFSIGTHTITLTVTDNEGASEVDTIFVNIVEAVVPVALINDTGIILCASIHFNDKVCPEEDLPNQDAEHGRDAFAQAGKLNKVGSGAAGFDYTKICNSGEEAGQGNCPADPTLGSGPNEWGCTLDNVTNLIWELKTTDGLHDKYNTYSWYSPDVNTNGGYAGIQNAGTCTGSDCDTNAFMQAVNTEKLCGISDWRMPTKNELLGIVHNGQKDPSIDTEYFPNTVDTSTTELMVFWSSISYALDGLNASFVDFYVGGGSYTSKENPLRVRLVHGTDISNAVTSCDNGYVNTAMSATTPTNAFVTHGDGTVTHTATGLMWMRCTIGQTWDGNTCTGSGYEAFDSWMRALHDTDGYTFAGYNNWRLPNKNELASIIEEKCYAPAINSEIFPNTPGVSVRWYWSSSPAPSSIESLGQYVWSVDFIDGEISYYGSNNGMGNKYGNGNVRLVRDNM